MNTLQTLLHEAFSTNFMLYYSSHVAHVQTRGENFYSNHKLLGKIYEDAQAAIDDYAEVLQTVYCDMPASLLEITMQSRCNCEDNEERDYIEEIYDKTEILIELLTEVYREAEDTGEYAVSTFVGDRLKAHKKFCYMLRSTMNDDEL
jgi:DNA-binding ferritin-like protein